MSKRYEEFKAAHPDWNWQEAEEEIADEDLEAAALFLDALILHCKQENRSNNS